MKVKELLLLLEEKIKLDIRNADKEIFFNEDRMNGTLDNRRIREVYVADQEQIWLM